MQFVALVDSRLSGAVDSFAKDELDFDPDWEIDPKDVKLLDKLGGLPRPLPNFAVYLLGNALYRRGLCIQKGMIAAKNIARTLPEMA